MSRTASCALIVACGFILSLAYVGPSHGDDVFIYMKYVRNLLEHGVVQYNIGERSDGITSSAYFLVMSGIALIFGNALVVWKTTSAAFFAAAIGLFFWTSSSGRERLAVPTLLASILALEPHLLRWSATGMENSLVALAFSLGLFLHARVKPLGRFNFALGLFWGSLLAVRPELLLFSAAYVALALVLDGRRAITMAAGAAFSALACVATVYAATGFVLPETSSAKAIFLEQPLSWYAVSPLPLILISGSTVSIGIMLWLLRFSRSAAHWSLATLTLVFAVTGYLIYVHTLISTRYATSLSFPLLLAALYVVSEYLKFDTSRRHASPILAASAAVQILSAAITLWYFFPFTRVAEEADIRRFSEAVNLRTKADDRIALSEIGVFGFYSARYVVDVMGLVDPETLSWGRENGTTKTDALLEQLIKYRKADYFVCAFCKSPNDFVGKLSVEPVYSQWISSGNGSNGRFVNNRLWVLYRVRY